MSSHPLGIALEKAVQQARTMDAPLRDRLQLVADRVRSLSDLFADAVERMISRQQDIGAGSSAPAPGDLMPSFLLPDDQGVLVSLEDLLRQGPVVISFAIARPRAGSALAGKGGRRRRSAFADIYRSLG